MASRTPFPRLLCALLVWAAPAAQAQMQLDMTNMLRSLSGALRGKEAQPPKQEGVTPVMGVRGIDEPGQTASAAPVGEDYVLMEGWAATRPEATATAAAKGLAARPAALKDAPGATGARP